MTSFLGTPIRVGDRVYGNLYLTDKIGADEFTRDDEVVIEALAVAAASPWRTPGSTSAPARSRCTRTATGWPGPARRRHPAALRHRLSLQGLAATPAGRP